MTTYCLNPNETWLAVYKLNTATMPTNNVVFSDLIADLSASGTSATIKAGEGAMFEAGMIATIEQLNAEGKATAREVILINGITDNVLSITRGYEKCVQDDTASPKTLGNTPKAFTTGARISVYVSKALLNGIQTRLKQVNCPCNTQVYNDSLAISSCVQNNCDDWRDKLYQTKASRCFNDCGFGDGSDGDCIITEDTFLDANCDYNFKNLTICEGVLVRFTGAGTPRINVQRKFCNLGTIDLRGGTFVGGCSKTDNLTGCTISNNACQSCYTALCFGCGGSGGQGTYCPGSAGSNATNGAGGDGGAGGNGWYYYRTRNGRVDYDEATPGGAGGVAIDYNGGKGGAGGDGPGSDGGEYNSKNRAGGGGGGGGGYFTGNGGNGGNAGAIYKGQIGGEGGNGGNAGIWGRGGNGGQGTTNSNSCAGLTRNAKGGNGGNGYLGGDGGLAGTSSCYGASGGHGGNGIVCGGKGADSHRGSGSKSSGKGGCAINNMYGLILHACEFVNNCIEAQGGKGGDGGNAPRSSYESTPWGGLGGAGGCGANGGHISIAYIKMLQQGNINISGGCGGKGGYNYENGCCCSYQPDGANGTDGYCVIVKPF